MEFAGAWMQFARDKLPKQDFPVDAALLDDIVKLEAVDAASDIAYLSGSLVEGLGNPWSDLDVYVVTDRPPVGPTAFVDCGCMVSIHYVGELRVDYEYWPTTQVRDLADRLSAFEPGTGAIVNLFSEAEEQFVHRLVRYPLPIAGDPASLQAMFSLDTLNAYQIQIAVKRLDSMHEDLCGMIEGRNWDVALFAARELAAGAMDVYLHIRGNTNPSRKWRASLIRRYADDDDAFVKRFFDLQFPDARRLKADTASLFAYCRECIAYHAAIVRIAHRD
jgi:hypothetical protein